MHHLEAINETSYLSVPNAGIYRKIMRYIAILTIIEKKNE